jgi:hypothetical protein
MREGVSEFLTEPSLGALEIGLHRADACVTAVGDGLVQSGGTRSYAKQALAPRVGQDGELDRARRQTSTTTLRSSFYSATV